MNALLDMIDLVYEAPQTNGAGWHDLIDRFGEAFPHCHTVLGTYRDGAVELSQTATDIPDSFMQEYSDHFVWVNPVVEPLMNVPGGSYFDADSFISNSRLRQTEIYNDFWVRLGGLDRNTGVILENGNGFFSTFCTHYPSRFRVEDPDGSPDHVLNRLMPHLRRALALQRKIEAAELMAATLTDAINASRAATFIVDREKTIRFHNTAAEEMLISGDIVRSGHLNRLTFTDTGIREAVLPAIARATDLACETHDTVPLLHSGRDGTVLRISVMPAPSNQSFGTLTVPYRRVGTMDCSIAPLTEPDMRTTHPALWIGPSKCQLKLGRYLRGVKFHPSGFQRYQSSCEPGNRIGPRHARTVGLVPNTPAAIRGTGGSPAARPHCQKMPEKEAGSLLLTHDDSSQPTADMSVEYTQSLDTLFRAEPEVRHPPVEVAAETRHTR